LLLRSSGNQRWRVVIRSERFASAIAGVPATPFIRDATVALYSTCASADEGVTTSSSSCQPTTPEIAVVSRLRGPRLQSSARERVASASQPHFSRTSRFRSSSTPRAAGNRCSGFGDRHQTSASGHMPTPSPRFPGSGRGLVVALVLVVWMIAKRRKGRAARVTTGKAARPTAGVDERADALERAPTRPKRDGRPRPRRAIAVPSGPLATGRSGRQSPTDRRHHERGAQPLDSARFDDFGGHVEAVAYGGRPAGPPDVDTAGGMAPTCSRRPGTGDRRHNRTADRRPSRWPDRAPVRAAVRANVASARPGEPPPVDRIAVGGRRHRDRQSRRAGARPRGRAVNPAESQAPRTGPAADGLAAFARCSLATATTSRRSGARSRAGLRPAGAPSSCWNPKGSRTTTPPHSSSS